MSDIRFKRGTVEAIQLLEEILNAKAFTQLELDGQYPIKLVARPSTTFLNTLFSSAPPITALRNYALALQQLSADLSWGEHLDYKSAENLIFLAIAVHRNIVSIHGHVHKVDLAIALSLPARSSRCEYGRRQILNMANESTRLLRLLAEKNSLSNARQELVSVLWAKPWLLSSDTEKIAFWEEALADRHFQDSASSADALRQLSHCFRHLRRHNDAIRTRKLQLTKRSTDSWNEAWAYFDLSKDLLQVQRYQESTEAARSSVALFRRLAIKDSSESLAEALSNLAHCMAASADYSEASLVWKNCMNILDGFLITTPKRIDLTAFDHYPRFSYTLQDEEECLKVCSTAVRYLRQLLQISSPEDYYFIVGSWLWAEFRYSYNLVRVGRLQHGQQYIEESSMYCCHWFDTNQGKLDAFSESKIAAWHSQMANLRADGLNAQGYTERAVLCTQDGQGTLKGFVSDSQFSFLQMTISMVQEARLRVNLDSSNEALRIAEVALQLSQDRKPELISTVESLAWSLHGVASTALSIQNYTRAAEAAREGCSLCSSADWKILDTLKIRNNYLPQTDDEKFEWENDEGESDIFLRPGLFAFLSSAEANLGRYGNGVEYARCAVEISLDIQNRKAYISATTAQSSYMETRGNLAEVLLPIGDFAQAREICEERRAYFSKRVETRTGEYRDLVPILHMLGILYCNEGRHEEGNDVMEELSGIVKKLGIIFPELEKQVKYRLRNRFKVPILKVLEDMRLKLDCKHQEDIQLLCTL